MRNKVIVAGVIVVAGLIGWFGGWAEADGRPRPQLGWPPPGCTLEPAPNPDLVVACPQADGSVIYLIPPASHSCKHDRFGRPVYCCTTIRLETHCEATSYSTWRVRVLNIARGR